MEIGGREESIVFFSTNFFLFVHFLLSFDQKFGNVF
jgi:hypothetical protein